MKISDLMKLSLEERERILKEQAEAVKTDYVVDKDWEAFED